MGTVMIFSYSFNLTYAMIVSLLLTQSQMMQILTAMTGNKERGLPLLETLDPSTLFFQSKLKNVLIPTALSKNMSFVKNLNQAH